MRRFKFRKVLFGIFVVYVAFMLSSQVVTVFRINNQIKDVNAKLQQATEENKELQQKVDMSSTNLYIERIAREKDKLIKKGEIPVVDQSK